ncbi:MAG: hypothetical protein ACI9TV_001392 [Sulfurimonas sp.]|jgi:hypothetical protein|uniref:hypothetical protein n=1 Tax=Sulfurimonas sp. TaxID=2022749 RepID=UPI0039E54A44
MKIQSKFISMIAATALLASVSASAEEIIEPTGIDQIKDIVQNDTGIKWWLEKRAKLPLSTLNLATPSIDGMNALIKEAIKVEGLVNDGVLSIADVREINTYLVTNHANTWYELRGQNAGNDSTGFYTVNRRGVRSNTTILDSNAVNMWGHIYNLGFEAYSPNAKRKQQNLTDYTGRKQQSFTTVGYWLGEIMKADIASGELNNPDYEEVEGTTGTKLDIIVKTIFNDQGLLRRISTGDMREGATSADGMNHLIVEAIKAEGLGNDGKLTTADIRTINNYLVSNHKEEWAGLHGDDENNEETGYHTVQNDGAHTRMFADNVMNSVADGIYHLGFETNNKNRLLNEDGNKNKSFEKVAWWLDTALKTDLLEGKFNNPEYEEVEGTTGTTFDKIVPYIYNDQGLLLKVSMEDIRAGANAANEMNKLIVEAIKTTGVAADNDISTDDAKTINQYLVSHYQSLWAELHGDDENGEETGYHRIQNDGARGIAYNTNVMNSLADGIYHLGFETPHANRLVNEDGNKNKSFKKVAYWLNKSLQEDYAVGILK